MSSNDPWGNRGNNGERGGKRGDEQGPPDLEDIWRDFNQRLSGMFGRRREEGPSGPGGPGRPGLPSFKQFGGGLGALVLLVLVVWLCSGFYIVDTNERGVVLRLGKYNTVTESGLNWRLPWPIETHEIVDFTGLRMVSIGGKDNNARVLMLTDDLNIVAVQFAVQYVIKTDRDEPRMDRGESVSHAKNPSEGAQDAGIGKAEHNESDSHATDSSEGAQDVETGRVEPDESDSRVTDSLEGAQGTEIGRAEPDESDSRMTDSLGDAQGTEIGKAEPGESGSRMTGLPEGVQGAEISAEFDGRERGPRDFLFNNLISGDEFMRQIAEAAMREIVGKSKMDFVLYEGREQIAAMAQGLIQDILDRYRSGIQVSRVTMEDAQPPEQVQAAFDDATKATQDQARQINEGEAYEKDVVPKAQGTASRLRAEAEAYRASVVARAEGEAVRFTQVLSEFKRAPQVTRERMYLDAVQQVLSNTSKVMIDNKGGNNLLYLPIDKLVQQPSGRGATAATGVAQPEPAQSVLPPPPAPSSQGSPRDRDFLRDRSRGD